METSPRTTRSGEGTTADLSALRLHAHFDEGSGPAIVMLHGINSDGGDWRAVIDTIGPGYRFVAFDLLGFGASPKPLDIDYSADEHALVIENTLIDLGVDDPFLLAGYSLGGDIALRYASTYPSPAPQALPARCPVLPAGRAGGAAGLQPQDALRVSVEMALGAARELEAEGAVLYKVATGVGEAALKDAFHAEDIPTHWEIMSKNLTNTINAATWVDDLPKLTMPVVHAIGVRDAIVKIGQAPALKRLKPDMEIRPIYGLAADHMTLWNMPEKIAEEIMRDEVRELNVAWRGGSGDPLVLLHGIEDSSERWIPAAEALARTNDVAVIDLLGFGDSPAPQSLLYTLAGHVAAVLGTVNGLWGFERPVRFAGDGFGATVALGCAATMPERSAGVIAFSPALLEPGATLEGLAKDETAARAIALREVALKLAKDERKKTAAAEKAEARLIPIVRTVENGVLAIDPIALLAQVPPPVRFVVPEEDTLTPATFLSGICAERDGFEIARVPGDRGLPYSAPAEAVRAISPNDVDGIILAERTNPVPRQSADSPVYRATAGLRDALLRAGLLNLIAAAVILLLNPVPEQLLTFGFAAWVAIASLSAVFGAVTMKRKTAGTRFTFTTTALPRSSTRARAPRS